MRFVIFLFVLLSVSCISLHVHAPIHAPFRNGPVVVLHGDTAFTTTERQAIEQAATTLAYYTNSFVSFRIDWDLDWNSISSIQANANNNLILRINSTMPAATFGDLSTHGRTLAFVVQDRDHPERGQQMFLVMDRIEDRLRLVAMHELLHVLWVKHQPQSPPSLMSPRYTGVDCPSKAEMTDLCETWGCEIETDVRWCATE